VRLYTLLLWVLLLFPALLLAQVRQRYTKPQLETHLRDASKQLVVQLLGNPAGISKLGDLEILVYKKVIDDPVTPNVFVSIKNGVVVKITYSSSTSLAGLKARWQMGENGVMLESRYRKVYKKTFNGPLAARYEAEAGR
jgi:hypothetical protein